MKLYWDGLVKHLKSSLSSVYLVTGQPDLLRQDAIHRIITRAKELNFNSSINHYVDKSFDVEKLALALSNQSLFNPKHIHHLLIFTESIPAKLSALLTDYLKKPDPNLCIVLQNLSAEGKHHLTAFGKLVEQKGSVVTIYPFNEKQFHQWLTLTAKNQHLALSDACLKRLQSYAEGDLTVTNQILIKLGMTYGTEPIILEHLESILFEQHDATLMDMMSFALSGQIGLALKHCRILKHQGLPLPLVLWSITQDCRKCLRLSLLVNQGQKLSTLFQQWHIWPKQQNSYQHALKTHTFRVWQQFINFALQIDSIIKGRTLGSAWDEIEQLITWIAGIPPQLSDQHI